MINVTFTDQILSVTASKHLYQWDLNQKLSISGLENLENTFVHFTNKVMKEALVVKGTVVDESLEVDIPNELLEYKYNVIAYVYLVGDNTSNTVRIINIGLEPRTKPADYQFEKNVDVMTFQKLQIDMRDFKAEVNNSMEQYKNATDLDISNFKTEVNDSMEQYKDATDSDVEAFKSGINDRMSEFQTEIDSELQLCRDATSILQLEYNNLDGGYPNTEESLFDEDYNGGYPIGIGGM